MSCRETAAFFWAIAYRFEVTCLTQSCECIEHIRCCYSLSCTLCWYPFKYSVQSSSCFRNSAVDLIEFPFSCSLYTYQLSLNGMILFKGQLGVRCLLLERLLQELTGTAYLHGPSLKWWQNCYSIVGLCQNMCTQPSFYGLVAYLKSGHITTRQALYV